MKHSAPKITAPADHNSFGQAMTSFEHTLYANFHHLTYLPLILFVVAFSIVLASFATKHNGTRAASYAVAVLLVAACIFIL
jgi:hypothetical protein